MKWNELSFNICSALFYILQVFKILRDPALLKNKDAN